MKNIFYLTGLFVISVLLFPHATYCQNEKVPDGTEGIYHTVHKPDSITGKVGHDINEVNTPFSTFKIGAGLIYDFTAYQQDATFKQQMDSLDVKLDPIAKLRDFRILGSGKLNTKRTLAWKFAFMWNGDTEDWLVRETGLTIGVPELAGHIFIGRTKEGYSMVKVMNGHSPWSYERQMALDVIPILADGIKWFGHLPKSQIFWNLGYFNDMISEGQSFSTFEWQWVARVGWLPLYNKEKGEVLHIAANLRYAKPLNEQMTLKSRPESNPTPLLINTGKFSTDNSSHIGGEIYYSKPRFLIGTEFMVHKFYGDNLESHDFFGGNVAVSYMFTRGSRSYNTVGSIYGFVQVKDPVSKGGWGVWEGVLTASTLNLNSGSIKGGQLWRITPMINWYPVKFLRIEFIYGYGVLDRFNLKGAAQFFESRIQFTIM
jgi:phosphate-selective porin OprO and OprP